MNRILLAVLTTISILCLLAVLWYGFGRDPSIVPNPLINKPAPEFSLRTTNGRLVNLSSLRGHPVIVNFFASWCVACQQEDGYLVRAYHRWHGRALLLGVPFQDSASAAASFERSQGGTWSDLVDPGDRMAIDYGVTGVPETFFIDGRGRIVYHTDFLSPSTLQAGFAHATRD